jgi:hypothetical protein
MPQWRRRAQPLPRRWRSRARSAHPVWTLAGLLKRTFALEERLAPAAPLPGRRRPGWRVSAGAQWLLRPPGVRLMGSPSASLSPPLLPPAPPNRPPVLPMLVHCRHMRSLRVAGETHPSALAREGDEKLVLAALAAHPREAVRQHSALQVPGLRPAPRTGAGRAPPRSPPPEAWPGCPSPPRTAPSPPAASAGTPTRAPPPAPPLPQRLDDLSGARAR